VSLLCPACYAAGADTALLYRCHDCDVAACVHCLEWRTYEHVCRNRGGCYRRQERRAASVREAADDDYDGDREGR
jgi:hypothetical protein